MIDVDKSAPVLITGATGYVAGWIVKRLLDQGVTVHAAIRDPDNAATRQHLDQLAAAAPGHIEYFRSDLLEMGSYGAAMRDCRMVLHTASPFVTNVGDPQRQLIDPALLGTRNVLEEASRTPSVGRVVLTSSCAAIYGDNIDLLDTPHRVFTEEIWNTSSSLSHNPYSYSKMLAEKEAWEMARAQERWDLVVLNPSLVIGPGINPQATSESFRLIKQLGDGTMKSGAPDWGIGVVDVRDLADAHLRAAFLPDASGRHIISAHNTNFLEMARPLVDHFGDAYPFPRRKLPKWLVWLVGPITNDSFTRKMVSRNVGYPFVADHTKSIRKLGMTYRPLEESMVDFFQQLVDSGAVPRPSSSARSA